MRYESISLNILADDDHRLSKPREGGMFSQRRRELSKLAAEDPDKAELVKLRFFAGPTMSEIARVLKVWLATAECHWTYACTRLCAEPKDRGNSERP